ncbi:MAG: DUF4147 domain-containing protein [Ahrensia sp.]
MTDLADDARACFNKAVDAAKPFERTRQTLAQHQAQITAAAQVHIIAAGKAALDMVEATLMEVPPPKRGAVIAVTNYENERPVEGCTVFGANHPVPDEAGEAAARAIEQAALAARADDLVICLISGGASALMPAPVDGITLADKIETTELLLKSGADITAFNTVRKALSRLKGGGLARALHPAKGFSLILSDVPGDDMQIIASGPTVISDASVDAASAIIDQYKLMTRLPVGVQKVLKAPRQETRVSNPTVNNILIGSNAISLATLSDALTVAGYSVHVLSHWLEGDAEYAAQAFVEHARQAPHGRQAIIAGGETSVHVTGTGSGGRNQHMALSFAINATDLTRRFAFLSGGTDGRDGPTDAAGGLVTNQTNKTATNRDIDLPAYLANNDSYHALKQLDALLITGPTGTNVADLQLLLLE